MNRDNDSRPTACQNSPDDSRVGDDSGETDGPSHHTVHIPTASLSSENQNKYLQSDITAVATTAMSAASLEDLPSQSSTVEVVERENFLMFIKILFKILEDAREPATRSKAQRIVMECNRRSKQGDPNFSPLMDALERRLRGFVGEAKWRRAHLFLHHYMKKHRGQRPRPVVRQGPTALLAGTPL